MATTAQLKIQIQADMAQAKKDLEAINQVVAELDPTAQLTAQSLREVDSGLSSLQGVVLGAATAFLSLQTAMQAIRVSDDYNQMASRLKMATSSAEEYEMVQRQIMETADRTYKPLAEQQELFIKSASSMKEMGYSTKETLNFLDSVSSSLTINSASADKFARANDAISKAMVSGKLAGNEWQAVMETMPTAIKDIADHLDITESTVKKLAAEGKLSIGQFVEAMNTAQQKNAELAENMPTTFGDAVTKLKNHLSAYLGEANNSIGASEKLVEAVNFITQYLDQFAKVIGALVTGALVRYGVILVQNTLTTIKAAAAKKILIAQEVALAQAQVAATRAAMTEAAGHTQAMAAARAHQAALVQLAVAQKAASTVMFGMGLPGLAMTVASVAAGFLLFRDSTDTTKEALVDLNISLDESIKKFNQLESASSRNAAIANTKKTVSELKKEYQDLVAQIHTLDTGAFKPLRFTDPKGFDELLVKLNEARNPLQGQKADWDKLSASIANSGAITEQYKNSLLSLVGQLKEKDEEIQKGIELAAQQEAINKELSTQDKEQAEAKRQFINAASSLDGEIKKLTGSIDSNINSSRTSADVISSLEAQIAILKETAGATPERINELTVSLDKLKAKQQELNNINNDKFIANLKKQNETAGMSSWDKQRYEINNDKTWTDDKRKVALASLAQGEAQENARKAAEKAKSTSDSLAKSNLSWVEGLEKQNATLNLGKVATLEYELAQKQLSGALLERAKASIEAFRAAQQLANAKVNSGMQVDLLRINGDDLKANLLEIQNQFKATTESLKKEGNDAGVEIAKQLFSAQAVKAQLDATQAQVEKYFTAMRLREQTIEAQVQAGQITEYEGQKRLTDVHKATAAVIKKSLPDLEKMAQLPGAMGEQARHYLTELNSQLLILQTTTNELENAFRNGLQDGIQSSIDGLVKGTMDLHEALNNFLQSIASSVLNQAVQEVANMAGDGLISSLKGLGGLFGMGSEDAGLGDESNPQALAITTASEQGALAMQMGIEQGGMMAAQSIASVLSSSNGISALGGEAGLFGDMASQSQEAIAGIQSVQAAKTAADTTIAASSAAATATTTASTTAAATAATTAWAPAAAASSVASFGTAAMIGLAALMTVLTAVKAFNTGGEVNGPGTGTSDSIPAWLSNGEFVTRAAVMKQHGAKEFAHLFNRHGMAALDMVRVRHSTGGMAGIPAPNIPAPVASNMKPIDNSGNGGSTTLKNNQSFVFLRDPNELANFVHSDKGKQTIIAVMSENPQLFKSAMEIG